VSESHREKLMDVAMSSPAAVAVKDRAAWMSIFAHYSIVEDPVGSRPHVSGVFDGREGCRSQGPLQRFYDTFIAPNEIKFRVAQDIVVGQTVCRELVIELGMNEKVKAEVPMHAFYQMVQEGGEYKVCRLAAHWELVPMILQVMGKGVSGMTAMLSLGWRMVRIQRLGGILGFCLGFRGIHGRGKELVGDFSRALETKNSAWLNSIFHSERSEIHLPSQEVSESQGVQIHHPAKFLVDRKISIATSSMISAGYCISCVIDVECDGETHHGIGLFEFNARSRRLDRVKLYWDRGV
jgi:hypothetical protein